MKKLAIIIAALVMSLLASCNQAKLETRPSNALSLYELKVTGCKPSSFDNQVVCKSISGTVMQESEDFVALQKFLDEGGVRPVATGFAKTISGTIFLVLPFVYEGKYIPVKVYEPSCIEQICTQGFSAEPIPIGLGIINENQFN